MRRRPLTLVLVTAFVVVVPAALAQEDDQLRQLIADKARAVGARWSVTPTLRIPEAGTRISSNRDGRIEVPLPVARQLVGASSADEVDAIVAWLMAHEVWHQVQYRNGWSSTNANVVEKRRMECAADVMAGYATLDDRLSALRSEPDETSARSIEATLMRIVDMSATLEAGTSGINDHPRAEMRQAAIRLGFGRSLKERLTTLADRPEQRLLRDRIAANIDIRSGEAGPAWADRMCALILHDGDGAGDLVSDRPIFRWNEKGNPPIVTYRLSYRNRGPMAIRATLQVRSVAVPRISPNDRASWITVDTRNATVTLQPGGRYDLVGALSWYGTKDIYPKIVFPTETGSFFNAVRIKPSAKGSTMGQNGVTTLSPELAKLKQQLQTIYNAARSQFGPVATGCEVVGGDKSCDLAFTPSGAISADVTVEQNGAASVDLVLYRGTSETEASEVYSRFRGHLRTIYPALAFRERTRNEHDYVEMSPSALASLTLTKWKSVRDNVFRVEATITPNLFNSSED